jgi:hypothetical protein
MMGNEWRLKPTKPTIDREESEQELKIDGISVSAKIMRGGRQAEVP